jgi:hypothetical protein
MTGTFGINGRMKPETAPLSLVFFEYFGKMCNECIWKWTFIFGTADYMNNLKS